MTLAKSLSLLLAFALVAAAPAASGDDGNRLLRVDHYVKVKSAAPGRNGNEPPAPAPLLPL